MISFIKFFKLVRTELKRDLSSNISQLNCVKASQFKNIYIVACPGSGKTIVLVLKALKFIFSFISSLFFIKI